MNLRLFRPWLLLFAAVALLVAGSHPASAQPVTSERVSAALTQLDALALDALARTRVPGMSIAVVYKDQVVYLKGFGVRDTTNPQPVDGDTVFQLASLSKPISSTVISAIVSGGLATWDDPLIQHDPGFQMYDPWVTSQVTLRDMFAHRSGLPGNAGNDLEEVGFDRDEILSHLRYLKPASSFRSTYAYSNSGMTAGGIAAAKAAGMSWEDASETLLYRPLGMTATSSRYAGFLTRPNRASIHIQKDGRWLPELTRNADPQSPAGGVSSSARDLAQWMRLQLGNGTIDGRQLIKREVLAQTHLPQIVSAINPETGEPGFYGLGWGVAYDGHGRTFLTHSGAWTVGTRTEARLLPAADLGIVVLTNAFPTGVPEAITSSFFDSVLEGRLTKDWLPLFEDAFKGLHASFAAPGARYTALPAQPTPALPLRAYTGVYANDYVGLVEVIERDGGLALLFGPQKLAFPQRHYDRDIFVQFVMPEHPDVPSGVLFLVGPDRTAQSVVIEHFNDTGQGTLTRWPAGR